MTGDSIKIYSERINARLAYACSEVMERRLGIRVEHTTDAEVFLKHQGSKLNYSIRTFDHVPSISPAELLFEKRIQPQDLAISKTDSIPVIFSQKESTLGFDPFAAVFYLLSRYELYLPHRTDEHGRPASEDLLVVKEGVYQRPLVEYYTELLFEWLSQYFPELRRQRHAPNVEVTIDVDQIFAYKSKGLLRYMLLTGRDVLRGEPLKRASIALGREQDPNDFYDQIIELTATHDITPVFFFQVGERSRFDINNPPHLSDVRQRVNEIALKSEVGLHPSYYSANNPEMLLREIERLRSMVPKAVSKVRQHYLRQQLPSSFRAFEEHGLLEDYSFGFHDLNGFHASTCFPFQFFDLTREETTTVTCFPMAAMDMVSGRSYMDIDDAITEMLSIWAEVSKFGGTMITTWHPESMRGHGVNFQTRALLDEFLKQAHVLHH